MLINKFNICNSFLSFKPEKNTKNHNSRKKGSGDSCSSISVECQDSGYEIFKCLKANGKVYI